MRSGPSDFQITQISIDTPRGTGKHTNKKSIAVFFVWLASRDFFFFLKLLVSFKFVYSNTEYIFIQLQTNQ